MQTSLTDAERAPILEVVYSGTSFKRLTLKDGHLSLEYHRPFEVIAGGMEKLMNEEKEWFERLEMAEEKG